MGQGSYQLKGEAIFFFKESFHPAGYHRGSVMICHWDRIQQGLKNIRDSIQWDTTDRVNKSMYLCRDVEHALLYILQSREYANWFWHQICIDIKLMNWYIFCNYSPRYSCTNKLPNTILCENIGVSFKKGSFPTHWFVGNTPLYLIPFPIIW